MLAGQIAYAPKRPDGNATGAHFPSGPTGILAVDLLEERRLTENEANRRQNAPLRMQTTAMRVMELPETRRPAARAAAFTLPEVVVSVFIIMLVFGAIITCYIQSAYRAEWSGFSLAAQAAAVQQLEAAKSAVWDPLQTPVMDQIQQLPTVTSTLLALPVTGATNVVYVTNYVTVMLFYYGPGSAYSNYMVTVNTVWPFRWANQTVYFTNTLADYFAPE